MKPSGSHGTISSGFSRGISIDPEVGDVRDENTAFSAVAAHSFQNFGLQSNGVTRPVWGYEVSRQYLSADERVLRSLK